MPNDKSLPEPETVAQQETGGDCVSRLVRLREAIKELKLAACDAREHLLSLEHRWMMDRAKPILEETDYHAMLSLNEANADVGLPPKGGSEPKKGVVGG